MVQAVIMAGGEGSRLRPLTCDRPKPMVPMLNRPVMEYTVELLKKHNITDIGVTLQYLPREIINYFGDGSGHGVNMKYFTEDSPLGTAGSIKNAESFLKDTFVVVSGDALTDFNLSEALEFHREKGALATLVLTPVEIPLEYGVVITEKSGEVRQFLEKPGWGEVFSDTVNTGIYILEPEVLESIPRDRKFDFSKDLFPYLLRERKPMFGVSLRGYWCDIGNHRQYQEAHYDAMEGRVVIPVPGNQAGDGVYTGANCRIDPTAVINEPVVIGNNCRIGRGAVVGPYAVLGDNCQVDEGATLKKSVVWNGAYIGRNAEIRGAVLCNKVTAKDRAAVYEGCVIGDCSVLEDDARVRPGTKIWPHKVVEKGCVVDTHLIWGDRSCRNLFGVNGISGRANVGLVPEFAAKLGAVYGSVVGPGSTVLVSSDHHRCTQMLKTALQAGMMSVGINVLDGGSLITPVHRNSVRALKAGGGVHIKSSSNDAEMLHINFFTGTGAAVSRDMERKIENQFERDDFRRHAKPDVGNIAYMPGLTESYVQNMFNLVDCDLVRSRRYRLVAHFAGENLEAIGPYIFSGLGCEIVNPVVTADREGSPGLMSLAGNLADETVRHGAHVGLIFDRNAEHVVLIDDTGRIVDEDLFLALMSLIILDSSHKPVVAVPVTGSRVVEDLAEIRKGRVIRTKASPAAFMDVMIKPEVVEAQGAFNQAVLTFDALSTTVRILEYMARRDLSLSQVISEIPDFHMTRKKVDCPWSMKGKVMRQLIEEHNGGHVELLDGVKVYHEGGWALVLPDADEPRYHVYSEGFSNEFAEELADFYTGRINQLKQC